MQITQIVGLGVVATIIIAFIRETRPEVARLLSLAVGLIIVLYLINYLHLIIDLILQIAIEADVESVYLKTLLRVIGIAYLAEFGSQICRDTGEGNIALKIEFAGKIMILIMAIPVLVAVLEQIIGFIP